MIDYTGLECPVCGKTFTEQDDDIVVCPECGAPHHRDCYTAHGRCGCAEQHGTDQAWDKQAHTAEKKKPCPHCQGLNEENAVFCVHCGKAIGQPPPPPYGAPGQAPSGGAYQRPGPNPYGPGTPMDVLNNMKPEDDLGGVTAGEIAKVVRVNSRYYLFVFSRILNQNKNRFNFAAFLLGGIWMLYRKQYKTGLIYTAINLALHVASSLASLLWTAPILENISQSLGITSSTVFTDALMQQVTAAVKTLSPGTLCLFFLPLLFSALRLAMNVFLGIKANRWYMKHCIHTVKEIREKYSVSEQDTAYMRWGGINTMNAFAVVSAYMIASYVLQALL